MAEFERRSAAMPKVKKAELLEGVVYKPSPTRHDDHGVPDALLVTWLGVYVAGTPGTEHGHNSTLRLRPGDNEPQPDALLLVRDEYGGQTRTDDDGYIVGGPELIGEIAASTVSYDLFEKLRVYERNGVREYIVWRVEDGAIDWFILRNDRFRRLKPGSDGLYRSRVFPGLWLDPQALLAGNLARVLGVVQDGLAAPEHQQFVAELKSRKK